MSCNSTICSNFALNKQEYTWLIDTGASISAIKSKHLEEQNIAFHIQKSCISGIGGSIEAKGYVWITLEAAGIYFRHKFFVFDVLPCKTAGIIGCDFLEQFRAVLDYSSSTMSLLGSGNTNIALPVQRINHHGNEQRRYTIPPRSENIYYVDTNMDEDCIISTKEIQDGIYIANTIVRPENKKVPVQILNTTEKELTLDLLEPEIRRLSDYHICQFDKKVNNADRVKRLLKEINLDHLSDKEQRSIENLCAKFADVFYLPGDKLTTTDVYEQSIHLKPSVESVFSKPYRLPHAHKGEIKRQIDKMLKEGIIEPAQSEWSSPILLVPKKTNNNNEKKWRLVIDYRKLNDRIKDDKFPLPNITEILDSLSGAIYYSHLDLFSGYYQVNLNTESRKYTAFSSGQYQMTRMPMGLKTSPSSFSRMINIAMSGLAYEKCFIYLDDLIVFGRNLEDHNKNLMVVLQRLRQVNLRLNPQKCNFLKKELVYLGHVVTGNGILPDPNKTKVMENYPIPKNLDEVKRFVAFANYYRKFIKNFAKLAFPLNRLCKKNQPFIWDSQCQESFDLLKTSLVTPPVLQYPEFTENNEFQVQTDASGYAIAGILSNKDGRPVAYASRSLNKAEINYPTIEKELLAIVWTVKHFRPYLFGRHFRVKTDHRPLVYLFSMKEPSSRLLKFRMALEEYDFTVEYVKGCDNAAADALSRIKITINELKEMHEHVVKVMTRAQARKASCSKDINNESIDASGDNNDLIDKPNIVEINKQPRESVELCFITYNSMQAFIKENKVKKVSGRNILLYVPSKKAMYINPSSHSQFTRAVFVKELEEFSNECNIKEIYCVKSEETRQFIEILAREIKLCDSWNGPRLYILQGITKIYDKDDQRVILNDFHLLPTSGHAGVRRMLNKIKKYFYWPGLENDIKNFISRCDKCQRQKHSINVKEPMTITTTANTAIEKVFLDIVGPLDQDQYGYKYILTIQCELSKFVEATPLMSKSAVDVAKAFVVGFILRYGIPEEIATDRGSEFISATMTEVCTLLKIKKLQSTAYHHQTIGALENAHKSLGTYLRIQTDNHSDTWSSWLPFWCFAYNTSVHSETKYTPFELVYGKKCNLPNNLCKSIVEPLYTYDDYPKELKYRLQVTQKEARENLMNSKIVRKTVYDKNINPIVYKPNDLVVIKNENRSKLDSVWSEPYSVIRDVSPNLVFVVKAASEIDHL